LTPTVGERRKKRAVFLEPVCSQSLILTCRNCLLVLRPPAARTALGTSEILLPTAQTLPTLDVVEERRDLADRRVFIGLP